MPASLQLDDSLTIYSTAEVKLLMQLAKLLPENTVLRARHQHLKPPSPLFLSLDLRLTTEAQVVEAIDPARIEVAARYYERALREVAHATLSAMPAPDREGTQYCAECGRALTPIEGANRGPVQAYRCDWCKEHPPTKEQLAIREALRQRTAASPRGF